MSDADFYDSLEPFYHLIYPNWDQAIARRASMLDGIIQKHWPGQVRSILDAACGIGTQSIGLAKLGYHVCGSDSSPRCIERAEREARARQANLALSVCDIRQLSRGHGRAFDLVIACDNALAHLLNDDELLMALEQMFACVRPGGGCLISVRDYAQEDLQGTQVRPYGVRHHQDRRFVLLQVWDCRGRHYDMSLYIIEDDGGGQCTTHIARARYYALAIDQLLALMAQAGFVNVQRVDGAFYQPVLVGSRP